MSVKIEIVVAGNFCETHFCYDTWRILLCQKDIPKTDEESVLKNILRGNIMNIGIFRKTIAQINLKN